MNFQVAREPLLRALQLLQNIVEPRQTLPILANVLLRQLSVDAAAAETIERTAGRCCRCGALLAAANQSYLGLTNLWANR